MHDRILKIVADEIAGLFGTGRKIALEDELVGDLEASVIDICCIAVELEEEFRIELSDEAIEGWRTVGDVVSAVERLASARV